MRWSQFARKAHYWGAILCLVPVLIVTVTGVLLLLKKDISWIQPPTVKLSSATLEKSSPQISFENILHSIQAIPELDIVDWKDVDRLDIRPQKGIVKVRAQNHWEAQLDQVTGEVITVAYRRSDVIEAIHDGTFFHSTAKLGIFLPASIILLVLSVTGFYLFAQRVLANRRKQKRLQSLHGIQSDTQTSSEPSVITSSVTAV